MQKMLPLNSGTLSSMFDQSRLQSSGGDSTTYFCAQKMDRKVHLLLASVMYELVFLGMNSVSNFKEWIEKWIKTIDAMEH